MTIINRDTHEGLQIAGAVKMVTEERVYAFSGGFPRAESWPNKNIHTNLDFAKSCGLPTRAASGAMFEGYITELMIDCFGENWLKTGKLNLKFIHVVSPGDSLISKAVVQSKQVDSSAVKVVMDVWCENQNGEKVAIGTAGGVIEK